jgi:hypothetical protein
MLVLDAPRRIGVNPDLHATPPKRRPGGGSWSLSARVPATFSIAEVGRIAALVFLRPAAPGCCEVTPLTLSHAGAVSKGGATTTPPYRDSEVEGGCVVALFAEEAERLVARHRRSRCQATISRVQQWLIAIRYVRPLGNPDACRLQPPQLSRLLDPRARSAEFLHCAIAFASSLAARLPG